LGYWESGKQEEEQAAPMMIVISGQSQSGQVKQRVGHQSQERLTAGVAQAAGQHR
jgi:hypothetical protein